MIGKARRTTDQVREVWEQVCNVGRSEIKSISPWTEFQGKEDEYALFHAFQRMGALIVLARGPGRLECFEPRGPEGAKLLEVLSAATKTRNTTAAIRKLGLNPTDSVEQLFDLYHRGELKLVRSPAKTLVFSTREVTGEEIKQITDDIDAKVDARLQAFEEFVALVETGANPSDALESRFGAQSS